MLTMWKKEVWVLALTLLLGLLLLARSGAFSQEPKDVSPSPVQVERSE